MTHKEWERFGAGAGIVGVGLIFVGFSLPGTLAADATAAETKRFLVDNQDQFLAGAVFMAAGILLFLGFLAMLRNVLRRTEGGTGELSALMSGAALVAFAVMLGAIGVLAGTVYRSATTIDVGTARLIWDICSVTFAFTGVPLAIFLGSAAVLMRRSEVFPVWLPWLGFVAAGMNGWTPASVLFTKGAWSPVGAMATFVPAVPFIAFVVVTGAILIRHPEAGEARVPAPAMATPA